MAIVAPPHRLHSSTTVLSSSHAATAAPPHRLLTSPAAGTTHLLLTICGSSPAHQLLTNDEGSSPHRLADPPLWRGPITIIQVIHLLEDLDVARSQYYPEFLMVGIYHASYDPSLLCYIRVAIQRGFRARVTIAELGRIHPINAMFAQNLSLGAWFLCVFVLGSLPPVIGRCVLHRGPWVVRYHSRACRRLRF
ncbi:hypothetical protein GOP47_0022857 [Adiantum capillus-veneris]|uniref:Uncharacterized protein n=1 Tax=Adiantum capillus-veneris TaxID=13818 RepID=A0A9D4Z4P6_ADICA|nr:hypothetical protein GOP47_0022857 [Adiantum capillus-veneris]